MGRKADSHTGDRRKEGTFCLWTILYRSQKEGADKKGELCTVISIEEKSKLVGITFGQAAEEFLSESY